MSEGDGARVGGEGDEDGGVRGGGGQRGGGRKSVKDGGVGKLKAKVRGVTKLVQKFYAYHKERKVKDRKARKAALEERRGTARILAERAHWGNLQPCPQEDGREMFTAVDSCAPRQVAYKNKGAFMAHIRAKHFPLEVRQLDNGWVEVGRSLEVAAPAYEESEVESEEDEGIVGLEDISSEDEVDEEEEVKEEEVADEEEEVVHPDEEEEVGGSDDEEAREGEEGTAKVDKEGVDHERGGVEDPSKILVTQSSSCSMVFLPQLGLSSGSKGSGRENKISKYFPRILAGDGGMDYTEVNKEAQERVLRIADGFKLDLMENLQMLNRRGLKEKDTVVFKEAVLKSLAQVESTGAEGEAGVGAFKAEVEKKLKEVKEKEDKGSSLTSDAPHTSGMRVQVEVVEKMEVNEEGEKEKMVEKKRKREGDKKNIKKRKRVKKVKKVGKVNKEGEKEKEVEDEVMGKVIKEEVVGHWERVVCKAGEEGEVIDIADSSDDENEEAALASIEKLEVDLASKTSDDLVGMIVESRKQELVARKESKVLAKRERLEKDKLAWEAAMRIKRERVENEEKEEVEKEEVVGEELGTNGMGREEMMELLIVKGEEEDDDHYDSYE